MLARIGFLLHFYRAQLPHGRTPIAGHTSLFTGVMPCQSPVDFSPTNRLNFSSPRTAAGRAEGELLITAFFLPSVSWKTIRVRAASEKGGLQACLLGGGESGPICILCSVARSWKPQAGSAKFDPKARAAAVSAAAGDEVPAACGGPSTPGGGPSPLHGTSKLPHCIEVRVGGVWGGAAPVVGIVAHVAEVGG